MKEKTKVVGIRLPMDKYQKLAEIAEMLHMSVSKVASTLVNVGMDIGDKLEDGDQK